MSDFLRPHELYSPWNSPRWDTGVGSLSLLQQIFLTQELNQGLCIAGVFFTNWAIGFIGNFREALEVLGLRENWADNTENYHFPCTYLPLLLASYISVV